MSSLYTVTSANRWLPPSKTPLTKFAATSACVFTQTSPSGNPNDTVHSLYSNTLLARTLPPAVSAPPPAVFSASGGTITTSGGTRLHTFLSSGAFTVTNPSNAKQLTLFLVGGGGGSAGWVGGGGGGGRVMTLTYNMPSNTYAVVVGDGGAFGYFNFPASSGLNAQNGKASSIGAIVSCPGGGAGGQYSTSAGVNGGCGGGGSQLAPWNANGLGNSAGTYSGPTLVSSLGNDGGVGPNNGNSPGAGGGGAGAAGQSLPSTPATMNGGSGGNGVLYSLTGNYYGGGGAGPNGNPFWGGVNVTPLGGLGGGGSGALYSSTSNLPGYDGAPNTGGGAGGGWAGDGTSIAYGSSGGSGIVIISYPYP